MNPPQAYTCDDPEGWYGEVGERRVQDAKHAYACGNSL